MSTCFKTDDIKNVKVIAEIMYQSLSIGSTYPYTKIVFFCGNDYVDCIDAYSKFLQEFKRGVRIINVQLIQICDNEFTVQNVD